MTGNTETKHQEQNNKIQETEKENKDRNTKKTDKGTDHVKNADWSIFFSSIQNKK